MKIIRVTSAILLMFSIVFTIFLGKDLLRKEKMQMQAVNYQGVISMWQIDSFEGGVGSRKQFLLNVARSFERIHSGVLVMVVNMTKEGAEENFRKGNFPDLISYGAGINVQNISEFSVKNTIKGGMIGEKIYATAWCRGGYVLIQNPNYKQVGNESLITVSKTNSTLPLVCLMENEVVANVVEVLPPMDAYLNFVSGKTKTLLGTQRDINRLERRGMEVNVVPLERFNDLYQYVSITSKDQMKRFYAERFIDFLVSEDVQKQLSKIGMLSCFYTLEYQNEHLNAMQRLVPFNTVSAFSSEQKIEEMHRLSLLAIKGNKDAKIKIENMLI